jgi:hypothetical protein
VRVVHGEVERIMKRIFFCLLVLFIGIGTSLPQHAGADPRRPEYDIPGDNNSGDDDEPYKTGQGSSTPSVGQGVDLNACPTTPRVPETAPDSDVRERRVAFSRRIVGLLQRLNIRSWR